MKHNYDEPTMQAAIDRACEETKKQYNPSSGTLMLDPELHYRSWPQEKPARLHLLKTALDHLPEPPPPVVDGKTPGQVCHESMYNTPEWKWLLAGDKAACESAASAVLAAFGNKPSQPTEIPWTEWHGGPCPLKNEEVAEWCYEFRKRPEEKVLPRLTATCRPSTLRWTHDGDFGDIIAYRVTKWREGFGPVDWKAESERWKEAAQSIREQINNQQTRAEKAEAELANWKEAAQVAKWQRDLIIDESTDKTGRILELEKLSTLRPISEAGAVPDGCVRVYGLWRRNKWVITMTCSQDTHCADIRLPESPKEANARAHAEFQAELEAVWNAPEVIRDGGEVLEEAEPVDLHAELKAAHAEGKVIEYNPDVPLGTWNVVHLPRWSEPVNQYRIKPTPETFTAHGKEWTPAVGNVVTLKSGSPKMTVTVLSVHKDNASVSWFNDGVVNSASFNVSTLIPA